MIIAGDIIQIVKGSKLRELDRGTSATVMAVESLGADYSHAVRVTFRMRNGYHAGRTTVWYARHINRLSDPVINLNDGNPLHTLKIKVKS